MAANVRALEENNTWMPLLHYLFTRNLLDANANGFIKFSTTLVEGYIQKERVGVRIS